MSVWKALMHDLLSELYIVLRIHNHNESSLIMTVTTGPSLSPGSVFIPTHTFLMIRAWDD